MEREAGEVVPLVKIAIEGFKTKNGTFQKPVFTNDGWVPRPLEWSVPVPVAAAPAAPQLAVETAGGPFVETPAAPAGAGGGRGRWRGGAASTRLFG